MKVHQLVLLTFRGKCPQGYESRHLNGDKLDNRLINLRWGTPQENHADRILHGTSGRKFTAEQIQVIRTWRNGPFSARALGKVFKCKYETILDIWHYRTYKELA